MAGGALAVAFVGFFECGGIDDDGGVELVLIERNAGQVLGYQIAGGEVFLLHGSSHGRDSGFDHVE